MLCSNGPILQRRYVCIEKPHEYILTSQSTHELVINIKPISEQIEKKQHLNLNRVLFSMGKQIDNRQKSYI